MSRTRRASMASPYTMERQVTRPLQWLVSLNREMGMVGAAEYVEDSVLDMSNPGQVILLSVRNTMPWADRLNMVVVPVPGTGDCWFESVAHNLPYDQELQELLQHLGAPPPVVEESFNGHATIRQVHFLVLRGMKRKQLSSASPRKQLSSALLVVESHSVFCR